jgi:hypothetical protein
MVACCCSDLRPTSAHHPDVCHVLTLFPFSLPSFFPDRDIPLDKISLCSYASSSEMERGKKAIPIGATGDDRHGQIPTSEMEQTTRTHGV